MWLLFSSVVLAFAFVFGNSIRQASIPSKDVVLKSILVAIRLRLSGVCCDLQLYENVVFLFVIRTPYATPA